MLGIQSKNAGSDDSYGDLVGGATEQGAAYHLALEGGGVTSTKALVETGFNLSMKYWFKLFNREPTSRGYRNALAFAYALGWDVR